MEQESWGPHDVCTKTEEHFRSNIFIGKTFLSKHFETYIKRQHIVYDSEFIHCKVTKSQIQILALYKTRTDARLVGVIRSENLFNYYKIQQVKKSIVASNAETANIVKVMMKQK